MTKLIVTPIDPTAPGSYRQRKKLLEVARKLDSVRDSGADWRDVIAVYDAIESLIIPRLRTDDGTAVEDALDLLSAEQFDELLGKVSVGADAVPPANASDSSSLSEDTAANPLNGS